MKEIILSVIKFISIAGRIDMLTLLRDGVVSTLNLGVTDNFGKLKYKQRKFACKSQLSKIHRAQSLNFALYRF